jgi:hypothetical protein
VTSITEQAKMSHDALAASQEIPAMQQSPTAACPTSAHIILGCQLHVHSKHNDHNGYLYVISEHRHNNNSCNPALRAFNKNTSQDDMPQQRRTV